MRRALLAAVLLVVSSAIAGGQGGRIPLVDRPTGFHPLPEFWIEPVIRLQLAHAWSDSAGQNERAFCAAVNVAETEERAVFTVVGMQRAVVTTATPSGITFRCEPGMIRVHVHPPHSSSLVDGKFVYSAGGLEAYECWPSELDQLTLFKSADPFALVQCDRNSVAVYWSPFYLGALALRQDSIRTQRLKDLKLQAFDISAPRPPQ